MGERGERGERGEKALEYLSQAQAAKQRQQQPRALGERAEVTAPRVSTTDPEARVMKMPEGGFRPAYNMELATDRAKGVIVGVAVTAQGTDAGQALPMEEQVVRRTGRQPEAYLMDSGFATWQDITALGERGITVYAPVRLPRNKPQGERFQPRYGESPKVVRWRQRKATEEAQAISKQRGATAEWVNAQIRQPGVAQFTVRGVAKVTPVALLAALAHNILRWRVILG